MHFSIIYLFDTDMFSLNSIAQKVDQTNADVIHPTLSRRIGIHVLRSGRKLLAGENLLYLLDLQVLSYMYKVRETKFPLM